MGSLVPESSALDFESTAQGESHTWRATREFALLGEILGAFEWGALDVLMFDLPPGAERTVQYADFLGPRTSFVLVTIPSEVARGVVARSVAALSKGPNRILGYVENMSGYYCRDCDSIKPLFVSPDQSPQERIWASPVLARVPFDPELARHCDRGIPLPDLPDTVVGRALDDVAQRLMEGLASMKFLCVPCDTPMKLQTVVPPERGSLSVVYACPECGYEIAMLTNAYETQVVQSLGVRIGPDLGAEAAGTSGSVARSRRCFHSPRLRRTGRCGWHGSGTAGQPEPVAVQWTPAAEARLANIPAFVRPMARTGIETYARERGVAQVDETVLDAARDFFGM